MDLPEIEPGTTASIPLPAAVHNLKSEGGAEAQLTVSFFLKTATPWAEAGHEIAWFQHELGAGKPGIGLNPSSASRTININTTNTELQVTGHNFTFTFDQARGYLTHWSAGGTSFLEPDPSTGAAILPSFWRPPTSNDIPHSLPYWHRFGVDALTTQLRATHVTPPSPTSQTAEITFTTYHTPPVLDWGYLATTIYTISASGSLSISVRLRPAGGYPPKHVPRVGLDLRLPRRLDRVDWLGLGPGESYPDKRAAQRVGIWSAGSVEELHTPYEVPQEGGNRMGTRWIRIEGEGGGGLRASAGAAQWSENCEREFSFKVGRYGDAAVQAAKHPCDLVEEEATLLRLDARVAGVGTAACGPGVREDLLVPVEEMEFGFCLEAVGL